MSAQTLIAGKCRHLIPIEQRCTRCVHEAEGEVLLAQLSPYARKKTGNQVNVSVPLALIKNVVEHLGASHG